MTEMIESVALVKAYLDLDNECEIFGNNVIIYRVTEDTGAVIAAVDSETKITVAATEESEGHWQKHSDNTVGVVDLHHPDSLERIKDLILGLMSDIRLRRFNFAMPQRGD
jgi:hypothetical protein